MLKGLEIDLLEILQYHFRRWGFENKRKGKKLIVTVESEEEWDDLQRKVHTLFIMYEDSILNILKENNKWLVTKNYFFSEIHFIFE